jgi:uncharacterized repeat protein (TIGR02543 family)
MQSAQVKGRVVEYHKDGTGNGYCVVIVSGTYYEMGYAQGYLLAHDILANVQLMKNFAALAGKSWASARTLCNTTAFLPQDTLDEFNGLADGVRAAVSTSTLDVVDFQTIALAGDWLNMTFCRTHSCWGSFVQAPVKTLTTRRADAPYSLAPIPFFFWEMIAYIPSGSGKTQWVNITSPGVTSGNTCVNEYGSVVASHDYNTSGSVNTGPNLISRHAVCRYLIAADMPSHDIATHIDYLYNSLRSPIPYRSLINGFANCFVPEGCGGVMELNKTITPGITNLRKPRPEFYAGEVILCANSFTDGTSMPTGAEFLTAYYNGTKPKTLQDHWDVTFENKTDNVVQMSVAYRNRGDMTIWWNGYLKNARTGTIKREWADLFGSTGTPPANTSPSVTLTTPVTGSTYTAPATMNLAATATDPDGTIAAVRFYSGTTLLNLDSASPYTYTWTGVSSGTYQLYATATDNQGAVSTSAVANVTVYPPNQPPAVSLTSPVNNSTWTAPATIQLTATATDSDGSIANVRFYRGSTLLNTDSASPYEYTWTNVSSGTYQLRAVAQDNQGATSTSTIITVTVLSSSTPAVWYTLTATANPANGGTVTPASGTYLAGSQIQVTATPNANYTFATWSGDASGTNPTVTITMDSDKSITANFTYVPPANSSPVVHITSPNDGATYTAPASITITATATDSDGSIAAVRFYAGTTLLATDSTSPYEYTWAGVPAGSYILTVQAQDNQGAVGTSTAIGITVSAQAVYYTLTVNANPSNGGTITQSPTGSSHLAGTPVTVTATPNAGYEFAGWSGDITGSSTTNPMTVVMDADKVLTANFRAVQNQQSSLTPGEVRIVGGLDGYINATQNPNVTIRFRRTSAGVVTVRIYDLRGRQVAEICKDGTMEIDKIEWNVGTICAGVYLMRINGPGIQSLKRLTVVK